MSSRPVAAELVVVKGKHRGEFVRLGSAPVTVGRSGAAELSLSKDTKVSGLHAKLSPLGEDRWLLEDLKSTNGTFLNDEQVEQSPLRSGDLIRIGRSLLVFRAEGSSIHLSDVKVEGGGSSADVKPDSDSGTKTRPPPYPAPASAEMQAPVVAHEPTTGRLVEAGAPSVAALQELLLAGSELVFARRIERVLDALLKATGAQRALLFVRHPLTGGLGAAASRSRAQGASEPPVQPRLLLRAAEGEVVAEGDHAAAPVRWEGRDLGAAYLVQCARAEDPARVGLLAAAGLQLGVMVGAERTRRLSESACEVVGIQAHVPAPRRLDAGTLLSSLDRLFGPGARHRGLAWRVEGGAALLGTCDPILLGRGMDTLVEHALAVARVEVVLRGAATGDGGLRLSIARDRSEPPEVTARLLDPEGVAADLRRMTQALDDGLLAVARAALERAGLSLSTRAEGDRAIYTVDLPARVGPQSV